MILEKNIELLKELVNCNSGSRNSTGVNQVQAIVAQRLSRLGFKIEHIKNKQGDSGQFLLGELKASANSFATLVTHADTVFEPTSGFIQFQLTTGGRATGPGVIDDKGSIVVALSGVEQYLQSVEEKDRLSLRFVCSANEETGSVGFLPILKNLSKQSQFVLGFEPSLEGGDLIHSRQGGRWYEIEVRGKEAHAGRAHRLGVNAAHELAIKVQKLQELTEYAREVTVNVGSIAAGQGKANVVCGYAKAWIDTRFPDVKSGAILHRAIEKIAAKAFIRGTKTKITITEECPPLAWQKASEKFSQSYAKIIKKIEGRSVKVLKSGGSADSSHMGRAGLPVLDGLGAVGGGAHTGSEWILLSSLKTRSQALAEFLKGVSHLSGPKGSGHKT
jgi:glutamate carboxypeptidase